MKSLRLAAGAAAAAAALLAAGCGGSGGGTTTTTSATAAWADSLCSATADWQSALKTTADTLKSAPTKQSLQDAAASAKKATQQFLDSLRGLGKPDTQSGQQAKAAVDQLQTQLQSGVDTMQKAIDGASGVSGVLAAVSTVSGTLVTMGNQVSSTMSDLKGLDAKGDLQQAFDQSSSCKALKG